jgi:EmrB/QacA subfamily drug resistance transporter
VTTTATTDRSRWMALYVLCGGMLMIVLDATIVNVALPSIQEDLGFSQNSLAWVVNAYLIAFGGLLLLSGRLGDLIGQRRIFLLGLAVFTSASLLCAVAQTQGMLIGARFVQGAGGAIASAVILGMIVTMFPEPREQAKAIGVYSFVASAGASIGLLLGGVLTEAINWHWIFFVNVPIGVAIAVLTRRLVEDRPGIGLGQGADVPGAALLTGGLMLGVYTLLEAGERGWGSLHTLGLGAIAVALLAVFVARQARVANPLMPLRLFRSREVAGANIVMALLVVGFFGMFFLGALYLQGILGYSPLEVGLAFLPSCFVMGTLSLGFAEKLIMGIGPRSALIAGLLAAAAGLALFARAPVDGNWATDVFPVMLLLGTGAGLASGLVNTTVQVAGAVGLAVLATLATERTSGLLADGEPAASALNSGYHLAYLIGAALVVVAVAAAALVLRAAPREQAAGEGGPAYAEAA